MAAIISKTHWPRDARQENHAAVNCTEERTRLAIELHDSISQNLTGVMLEIKAAQATAADDLSPRQTDILKGIVDGKSNTDIARELGISPTVVRDHTSVIFAKFGVTNRIEAVSAALRKQLLKI